jgi:RNA polymerase sigma-70 factor, ECF subfamily
MKNTDVEKLLEKLFNENFRALVLSSFSIVKDYEQSEDIVQNVFVKIWQKYQNVKHIDDLKPYLYKTVRNSSLNYIRDKNVKEERLNDAHNYYYSDTNLQIETENRGNIDTNKIHETIAKIPDKWREAFIFSKYENLKYREIADKMGISEKTVEKYISKALAFLRIELKDLLILFFITFFSQKL